MKCQLVYAYFKDKECSDVRGVHNTGLRLSGVNCTTYWAYWCFLCVFTGDQDEDKIGECPSVRNDTVGICLQNCTYDKECTGNQKCCSTGCGHVCVEPVSKVFKMTFRFNITWDSDYGDENSTKCVALTADILNQVR